MLEVTTMSSTGQEFSGPVRLLLDIVRDGELDILEIRIVEVIDAYIAELDDLPLDEITDFLVIAATLMHLKSRCLLPEDADDDLLDDLYRWEEKDLLLARLIECRTFRHASQHMQNRMESAARSIPRKVGLEERYWSLYPDPLEGTTPADLLEAYLRTSDKAVDPQVDVSHLAPIRFKVGDALEHLCQELPRAGTMLFRDVSRRFPGRTGFVIYFLAVLELWRQGHVDLRQVRTFGDITIEWSGGELTAGSMEIEDYGEGKITNDHAANDPSSHTSKELDND